MSVLIDPESYDDSEQRFASTLDAGDDTSLVHDLVMGGANDDMPLGDLSLGSTGTPIVTPQLAAPLAAAAVTTTLIEAATTEPPPQFYRPPEPPVWRDEVTSRVDAYHAKRGRGRRYDAGASSLSLDFDPAPEAPPQQRYAAIRLETVEKAPDTNLIEFPKPMPVASVTLAPPVSLPLADELAESIREIETPRILDVPDGAHTLPAHPLADIHLDEPGNEPALDPLSRRTELALPLPVAPVGPRLGAGLVDMLIVLTATAIFGMIFMMIAKELPQGRDLAACALALPAILWAAYHYAFLVRCGTTPGMQMTQLGLAPFNEEQPITLGRRRARALAMSVSAMSLWLGFVWSFLDEDRLAWHDRISHTFLVNE